MPHDAVENIGRPIAVVREDAEAALAEIMAPESAVLLLRRLLDSAARLDDGWYWTNPKYLEVIRPASGSDATRRRAEIHAIVHSSIERLVRNGEHVAQVYMLTHRGVLECLGGQTPAGELPALQAIRMHHPAFDEGDAPSGAA